MSEILYSETLYYEKSKNGIYLKVKVVPRASRDEVLGIVGNRVKVAVKAAPQKGEGNAAVEKVIAAFFSLKKASCSVVFGYKSTLKTVFIASNVVDVDAALKNKIRVE
jgi:uncharacterized protein (TIGR00251 family)